MRPLSWTVRMGLIYFILVALVMTYGLNTYSHLSRDEMPSEGIDEGHPLYEDSLAYGRYLVMVCFSLGAFLGLYSAYAGLRVKRTSRGLMILILGVLLTAIPFSLLPNLQFPEGTTSASLVWLGTGFYAFAPVWIGANLLAQFRRRDQSSSERDAS